PFHIRNANTEHLSNRVLGFLKQHQSMVLGTVVSGGKIFLEILAGLVLMLFVTFFLLKDGDRIWSWLTGFLSAEGGRRAQGAGAAAWQALTYYVRGTVAVAAIHAVVIGFALWVLGVPLLVPLVILVFIAAFIPLVGILVAGTLAVAVTLGTRGWVAALVLVAVFILENQLESHLLQPLVVGRMVRIHPLAIILVLAVGAAIAGIAGAIVGVPITAALVGAWPYLRGGVPAPPTSGHADQPQRREGCAPWNRPSPCSSGGSPRICRCPPVPTPATPGWTCSRPPGCGWSPGSGPSSRPGSRSPCPTAMPPSSIHGQGSPPGTASPSSMRRAPWTQGTVARSGSPCSTPTATTRSASSAVTGSPSWSSSRSPAWNCTRWSRCPARPAPTAALAPPAGTPRGSHRWVRGRPGQQEGQSSQETARQGVGDSVPPTPR